MKLTQYGLLACETMSRLQHSLLALSMEIKNSGVPRRSDNEEVIVFHDQTAAQLVAEVVLCRAVDIYQWYNRQILTLAVQQDPSVLIGFKDGLNLNTKDIEELITSGNVGRVLISKMSLRDRAVRDHIHKTLGVFEDAPMALLVEVRNCVAHALGHDVDNRVKKALSHTPPQRRLGITIANGHIRLSDRVALGGCHTVLAQLSIMDQELARRFKLPTSDVRSNGALKRITRITRRKEE